LVRLEAKSTARDAVLHFADGSTRAIRLSDPLQLLLDGWRWEHDRLSGKPEPESRHADMLRLLGGGTSIESEDNLILEAFACAQRLAREPDPEEVKVFQRMQSEKEASRGTNI
jgi:hypothetical protein